MQADRRYSEEEIKAIFQEAARVQESTLRTSGSSEGLTLAELQAIGDEAGLTPEFIARAAARLNAGDGPSVQEYFIGLPVRLEHTVALPGPMDDALWDRLVVDLRDTFGAVGRVRIDGALRMWSNGNLRVAVEPGDAGWRLRMGTRKADPRAALTMGGIVGGMGLFMILMWATGWLPTVKDIGLLSAAGVFFSFSLFAFLATVIGQPRWARTRRRQMEEVARRALERAAGTAVAARSESAEPAVRLDTPDAPATETAAQRTGRTRTT